MPDVFAVLAAAERAITQAVLESYRTWLAAVRGSVLAPFNRFRLAPDPNGVWAASPLWNGRVERFLRDLRTVARRGWEDAAIDLGEQLPFDHQSSILQDQLQRTRNLMIRTPDEVYRRVIAELAKGGSIDQQADRVRQLLDVTGTENWEGRARTVAATEVWRAYAFGGYAAAQRSQLRVGSVFKRWDSRRDAAVRNGHRRAHGQTVPLNQPFEVGGEQLMVPLDPAGSPSNVINCVPGSSQLSAVGVKKSFRYPYAGRMLSITRKQGDVATVSPNHPVLTEHGWVLARQLKQGDNLVCASDLLSSLVVHPDIKGVPPSAEQVYDSLMLTGVCERMIGLPMDFHGDGPDSYIDVVLHDGELSYGIEAKLLDLAEKLCFTLADAPDASGGALAQLLMGSNHAAHSIMCSKDLIDSLSCGHFAPFQSLGLGLGPEDDTPAGELSGQQSPTKSALSGEGLKGGPELIFLDQVLDVRDFLFDGHLFTFETTSGVYVSDGIVSHNCRCRAEYLRRR